MGNYQVFPLFLVLCILWYFFIIFFHSTNVSAISFGWVIVLPPLSNGDGQMCMIGRQLDPLCFRCREDCETSTHPFENCVTLVAIKCSIFGSTTATLDEEVHNKRLDEVMKFVSHSALCSSLPGGYPAIGSLYSPK